MLALLRTTLFLQIVSFYSGRYSDSLQAAIDFSTERFHLHCFKCIVFFKSLTSTAAHYLPLVLQAIEWRGWKTSCYPLDRVYHTTICAFANALLWNCSLLKCKRFNKNSDYMLKLLLVLENVKDFAVLKIKFGHF